MPDTSPSPQTDYYVPDGKPLSEALARTTHLAIVAHQDDLEINCFHGIAACYRQPQQWFTGIVLSDGAGSPRSGPYANVTDDEMISIRQQEQRQAAAQGKYSLAVQYGASSAQLKTEHNSTLVDDLEKWLLTAQPQVVYLHNLADRHDTHVHVALHALEALRRLPLQRQPEQVYGVEGWGSLDWLPQEYRIGLDVSEHRELAGELIQVFVSQVAGGKRYDIATAGRQLGNATFDQSHTVDGCEYLSLAMDLKPLMVDTTVDPHDYLAGILDKFREKALAVTAVHKRQEG